MLRTPLIALATAAALLTGCVSTNPDLRQRTEAMRMAQVQDGTILAVRMMQLLQTFHAEMDVQMRDHGDKIEPPMPFISSRY